MENANVLFWLVPFASVLALLFAGATDKPCGEGVRTLTQNCC